MALNDVLDRLTGKEAEEDFYPEDGFDYEYEDALEPDPTPDSYEEPKKKSKVPQLKPRQSPMEAVKLTKKQKDELAASVEMLFATPGILLTFAGDPVCGGALSDNAGNIADKLVPIICRNPRMVEWFMAGGNVMDYVALAQAVLPIGVTVYQHHVSKSIGHDHEEGYDDLSAYSAPRIQ